MTVIDAILWSTLLLAGMGAALWYAASWRAVARALAQAEQRTAGCVPAEAATPPGAEAAREPALQQTP